MYKRIVVLIENANDLQVSTLAPAIAHVAAMAGCRQVDLVYTDDPSFDLLVSDLADPTIISFGVDIGGLPDAPDLAERLATVINSLAKLVGLRQVPQIYEDVSDASFNFYSDDAESNTSQSNSA